jgi:integrase
MGSFRRNYLQDALTNAGLPAMRFHDLRHTAASLWLAAGFKPYEVSRWLGHANVSTTDSIYAHLYPSDYTQHVARFDAFVMASV